MATSTSSGSPDQDRTDRYIRVAEVVAGITAGAVAGGFPGAVAGLFFGVLCDACVRPLMEQVDRWYAWPRAFGFAGVGGGFYKGLTEDGLSGGLLGAFVGGTVGAGGGLVFGVGACSVAWLLRLWWRRAGRKGSRNSDPPLPLSNH
jgi:hypothetical protein